MNDTIEINFQEQFKALQARSLLLRRSTVKERKQKLRRLEQWILKHRDEIQHAVYHDLRKPPQETDITEIYVVLGEIRLARKMLSSWASKRFVNASLPFWGSTSYVYHEPKGACLIISPWNYPFQLGIAPLISAIAAGNSVMVKPSEFTANTATLIKKMCEEVFDHDEIQVVLGGVEESTALLKLPFDHIFFTGSPQVGKIVMTAAAKNLTSVTLELGGKSPTIVDPTASIKDAAEKISWGKWQNSGQVCIAPDYLFVHEDVKDELIGQLYKQSQKIYGKKENYASIVSERHYDRIHELIADAIQDGGKIAFGGTFDKEDLTFHPTLVSDISEKARIANEEIFGPLLVLYSYKLLEEVIDYINQRPKPLALYLFTRSQKNIHRIQQQTSAGMMAINEAVLQFANPHLPIGGVNNSGIGKSHGHAGFLAFTNEKAVLDQRRGFTVAKTVYPPYSKFKNFMIDLLVKYF